MMTFLFHFFYIYTQSALQPTDASMAQCWCLPLKSPYSYI